MIKYRLKKIWRWLSTPQTSTEMNPSNFLNVQLDAIGVGMASAALPFVPVFLARLGANNLQVGLLTSLPALAGLILSIPLGQFLETRKNIVRWYSVIRAIGLSRFAVIGIISIFIPPPTSIIVILAVWGIFTIPLTLLQTMFSVVMNAVAGPKGRFELMSRRWAILSITTAVTVFLTGQLLDKVVFPLNYQIVFAIFSFGGVLSYQFSKRLVLESHVPEKDAVHKTIFQRLAGYYQMVKNEKPFIRFATKRFVFMLGFTIASPVLPLYYVREINTPDSWIAIFSTAQTAMTFIGYFFWLRQSRTKGSRFILLATTFALSFYPFMISITSRHWIIAIICGIEGLFEAGLNLVFFDELMKTVPEKSSATFVSLAQSIQFLASTIAPVIATAFANSTGLIYSLWLASSVQIIGFFLFLWLKPKPERVATPV